MISFSWTRTCLWAAGALIATAVSAAEPIPSSSAPLSPAPAEAVDPPAVAAEAPAVETPPPAEVIATPQDASDGKALNSLSAVLQQSWQSNPEVNEALRALEATGYDVSIARTGYYPYAQIQTAVATEDENSATTLSLVLPIWSGGSTNALVDENKARQVAADATLTRVRVSVAQRAAEAYLGIAMAQDQGGLWVQHIQALKSLLGSIERRAQKGIAPDADVQIAITRLRQAQASAEANRAQLLSSRAALISLLGQEPERVFWPDESYMLADEEISGLDTRIELHPVTRIAQAQVVEQEATVRRARAQLWPDLSLQHRRQLEGLKFDPTNDDATLFVLQFQTTNGLRGFRGLQAEEQRVEGAKARLEAAKREVHTALITARAQLIAASAQLLVQEQAVAASDMLVESFTRQFEVGRKSWLELLNAHREAQEARLQFVGIKRNYWLANNRLALDGLYWHHVGLAAFASPEAAAAVQGDPQ